MSEDRSSNEQKSWFNKLTQAFAHEPRNRQELLEVLREAHQNKLLDSEALAIVEGAIQVADLQVRDIMIPRSQMVSIKACQSPEEFLPAVTSSAHSRYPVIGDGADDVLGILLAKDLLPLLLRGREDFNIREMLRPATFVPESKRLNVLLREFRANRHHMAIVIDEYGSVAGLVTIEDVLEQIVGDIEDEYDFDETESHIVPGKNGRWRVKAITELDDFNDYFHAGFAGDGIDTVGGLVVNELGHLPKRGETVDRQGWRFTVLRADSRRVQMLLVEKLPEPVRPAADA